MENLLRLGCVVLASILASTAYLHIVASQIEARTEQEAHYPAIWGTPLEEGLPPGWNDRQTPCTTAGECHWFAQEERRIP